MDNYIGEQLGGIHQTFGGGEAMPSAPFRAVVCQRLCAQRDAVHLARFPRAILIPSMCMCSGVFFSI